MKRQRSLAELAKEAYMDLQRLAKKTGRRYRRG